MTKVTYTGPAAVWRTRAYGGITASSGETIDVDDEDTAKALVRNEDFARAENVSDDSGDDPEYDVLTEAIDDLKSELDAGDHDDHLVALRREEEAHKNRTGALEAIDERRTHVAESGDESADEEE